EVVVRLWSGNPGTPVTPPSATVSQPGGAYPPVEFSPDGARLLLFTRRQGVSHLQVWDPETMRPLTPLIPCPRHAFSEDGRHLLTSSDDGRGKVWDVNTGAFLQDLPPGRFPAAGADRRPAGT